MKKLIAAAMLASSLAVAAQAQTTTPAPAAATADQSRVEQTHNDLRALKDRLVAAINQKNEAALLAELGRNVRVTTMDNRLSVGPDGASAYYREMMVGAKRIVKDMSLNATPDDLSILYADGRIAVATGTSDAHMELAGGKTLDVPLRWTATLDNQDGQWKVAAAHFSANMFDNPIMAGVQSLAYWLAAAAGLVGLLLGWLIGRRRKTA
jgi:ketosteroid isomerase-like protein